MKIVAAGVSGFIGTRLTSALSQGGHEVVKLVRKPPAGADQRQWDPDSGSLDAEVLDGADAVVNLCGAGVADKRWTPAYKKLLISSRVKPTKLLSEACASSGVPVLINGSAVGYYGHTGDTIIRESSPPGDDFLGKLCVAWEAATQAADAAGVRVAHLRTGLVIGHEGGLLPKLAMITKLMVGGRLGSGRQYYPWISATDEVDAIIHLLTNDVSGPVNLTGPNPVTNAEFTKTLGRALHRPTPWIMPGFAIKIVLGEFSAETLNGQRALPAVLDESGFVFTHATLGEALRSEIH